jgi:hypothetical protein
VVGIATTCGVPMRHLILVALAVPTALAAPTVADAQMSVSVDLVSACRIQAPFADRRFDSQATVAWSWSCGASETPAQVVANGVLVEPTTAGEVTQVLLAEKALTLQLDF